MNRDDLGLLPDLKALSALLDQGRDLHAITDAHGHLLWANQPFLDRFGARATPGFNLAASLLPLHAGQSSDGSFAAALLAGEQADNIVRCAAAQSAVPVAMALRTRRIGERRLWTFSDMGAEPALHERLQRLQELLDTAQEFGRLGVWERDFASGIGRWDDHVFRFWGLDPAQGTPSFADAARHIHPDDRQSRQFIESTRQPGRYSQRFRVVQADGSLRWLHSHWEVKAGADGRTTHAVGIMVDDSETMTMARQLSEATAKLTFAVDLGEIVIFDQNLRTRRISLNARGCEILGLPFDDGGMPIERFEGLVHPDDRPELRAASLRALRERRPVDLQARYRHADGRWRTLLSRRVLQRDAADQPLAFVGVALDVTERVQAQRALEETARGLEVATTAARVGLWSRDTTTGDGQWNAQMYRFFDRDPQRGPPSRDEWLSAMIHPDDRALMDSVRLRVHDAPDGTTSEYRIIRPDGSLRWLLELARREERDGRQMIFGATVDITDRKNADLALREADEVRREAQMARQQSEAKAALLARMSHELRTPLNAILGFTDLMTRDAVSPATAAHTRAGGSNPRLDRLAHIRQAAERLLELVDDVLDVSRIETIGLDQQRQSIDLQAVLNEVAEPYRRKTRGPAVRIQVHSETSTVLADPLRLRQILDKLVGHHAGRAPARGELVITVSRDGPEARIAMALHGGADRSLHQFELFPRADPPSSPLPDQARDVGLFGALLEGMKGRIAVQPDAAGGERMVMWLPLAVEPASPAGAAADDAAPARSRRARLLYIEDNPVNVILVDELVKQRGDIDFFSEPNGIAGVERAIQILPDLILIDIHLPDIDGFEVLRRLRDGAATSTICCIALSANAMPDDVSRARAAGFDDYWTKPIRFSSFLAGLDRVLPAGRLPVPP